MKKNKLITISVYEIKEKIKNHLLWLRWNWEEKDRDFSNIDFSYILTKDRHIFVDCNLTDANFQKSDIRWLNFNSALITWLDLRNAEYDTKQFNEKQLKDIILTDDDYKNYQERKKLEEENKILKKEVKQKNETIEIIWEEQTDKLIVWFKDLLEEFKLEEKRWLATWWIAFFCILITTSIPILDDFLYKYIYKIIFFSVIIIFFLLFLPVIGILYSPNNDNTEFSLVKLYNNLTKIKPKIIIEIIIKVIKSFFNYLILLITMWGILFVTYKIPLANSSIFQISPKFWLIPLGFILFSLLYFSLYQYSKAKQLRIENQNKIAILHWFQALRAEKWDWVEKWRFYDNISNVVFTKVYNKKISNDLPVDKLVELALGNLLKK